MRIVVNGKAMEIARNTNLSEFVRSCKVKENMAVVVLNERVVKKDIWNETMLTEGDCIELVSLIGGG